MNFPFFYLLSRQEMIRTFLLVAIGFLILIAFAFYIFIRPFKNNFRKKKNLIFLIIITIFITGIIAINSNYYWSIPVSHNIKICFDAEDSASSISVRELNHAVTDHLFSPESFGSDRYPLFIKSGECLNGQVTTFYRRIMRFWNKPGITVIVSEDPPDGRLFISANGLPTTVYFETDAEIKQSNKITIYDGFESGTSADSPWGKYWFLALRAFAIFISGTFLSLFFFGLTERVHSYTSKEKNQSEYINLPLSKTFKIKKPKLHQILLILTLIYFIVFGVLMAHTSGQPDQSPHKYYSMRFTETWGFPEDDPNNARIITGQPYLAYWINGAVYKIYQMFFPNRTIRADLLWRLVSVGLSTLTVYFTYKLATKVSGNPYAGILTAFFLSNTLMFVFISGGISYDNLMNLAGVAAIYHLVSLYKKEDFVLHTSLTGVWVVVGALSKEQFLLMTLLIFLGWLFFTIRNFRNLKLDFNQRNIISLGLLVVAIALFIGLYGVNLIRYSSTTPSCLQIKGPGRCGTYVYRQEFYSQISYPGLWFNRDKFQNPINYAFDFWIMLMIQSTWGIFSHNTFIPKLATALHGILILWSFISLVRYWKIKEPAANVLFYILIGFVGYVFFWNYKLDVEYDFHHYGVTGRYLFPSLSVLLAVMVHYLLKIRVVILKRLTIIVAIMIYFYGGLWMFLSRYSEVFVHWRIYYK